MFGLGTQELLIILAVAGLLFGSKKLPELGKGLGDAIRGFKKSLSEVDESASSSRKPVEGASGEEIKRPEGPADQLKQ
jgi:sec-independent protein translocase protein TatA